MRYVTASDVIKAHYAETGQSSPLNYGFLAMNDMWLEADPDELVGLMLDVEVGIYDISDIAARLKDWAVPLNPRP